MEARSSCRAVGDDNFPFISRLDQRDLLLAVVAASWSMQELQGVLPCNADPSKPYSPHIYLNHVLDRSVMTDALNQRKLEAIGEKGYAAVTLEL